MSEVKKTTTLVMGNEVKAKLDDYARATGRKKKWIIEQAVLMYISADDKYEEEAK